MGQPHLFTAWMYIPAALLAALGCWLLYFTLLRDRAKGHPRCPKCWYDMNGNSALPARCPECGHAATTQTALLKTRRRWPWAAPALLLLLPLLAVFLDLHAMKLYFAVMPRWVIKPQTSAAGTTITIYGTRDPFDYGARVVVTSDRKTILDHEDIAIDLSGSASRPAFFNANDDGIAECMIECYSGGAHCCYRVFIIELRPGAAAIVADIDARNGMSVLKPRTLGGDWLFNIPDQSFDYWKTSHAESPAPSVYYRLHAGRLEIALDALAEPIWHPDSIAARADEVAKKHDPAAADPPPVLWSTMLHLIYSGNEPQAWIFFDSAWPASRAGKEAFRKEFLQILATDPWYQDLTAALAARAAGKPISPSIVGQSGRASGTP